MATQRAMSAPGSDEEWISIPQLMTELSIGRPSALALIESGKLTTYRPPVGLVRVKLSDVIRLRDESFSRPRELATA